MTEFPDPRVPLTKRLHEVIGDVHEEVGQEVRLTVDYLGRLMQRQASGEDVRHELRHVEAQLRNWEFVGASKVRLAVVSAVEEWGAAGAKAVGAFVCGFVRELGAGE